jgi:hypothetical protein
MACYTRHREKCMSKKKTMSDKPLRCHAEPELRRRILAKAKEQRLPVAIVMRHILWKGVTR